MVRHPHRVTAFALAAALHIVAITAAISLPPRAPAPLTLANAGGWAPPPHERNESVSYERGRRPGAVTNTPARSEAIPPTAPATGVESARPAEPSPAPDRFAIEVLQNRYPLSLEDGQLSGPGALVLQSAIAQSRFVLVGEEYGRPQTPEFCAALCDAGRFDTIAIEEGPLAAVALESWARRRDGLAQLAAFEKTFPGSINIYNSRKEFAMLQQCAGAAQGEFRVWGLNQEALGASGLILSRILESGLPAAARPVMRDLFEQNQAADRKAISSGRSADLYMLSADDRDLAGGASVLERHGSARARSLFASLIESHEIHRKPPADYDNTRRRERLMKSRFATEYARASKNAATPPRVLLKFGADHIYRGLNPVRGSGIGNYVAELAEAEGGGSLHIRVMTDESSQSLQPILRSRLQSAWTVFDLRPLRPTLNAVPGATHSELATLVFGVDLLVVVF